MLSLEEIPAFRRDLTWGSRSLKIDLLGEVQKVEDAWNFLPPAGEGVVVRADSNRRYSPQEKTGLLLDADVSHGDETVMVRANGSRWKAWKWSEAPGDTFRYVEYTFLSSEPGHPPPHLIYRQYWTQVNDSGVQVWRPVGARFCGFRQEVR